MRPGRLIVCWVIFGAKRRLPPERAARITSAIISSALRDDFHHCSSSFCATEGFDSVPSVSNEARLEPPSRRAPPLGSRRSFQTAFWTSICSPTRSSLLELTASVRSSLGGPYVLPP